MSAYLLVAIVGMVMVKTTTSCLQRLRDCRWLLLALLAASGLYALPELFVRSTVDFGGGAGHVCILGVGEGAEYAAYVTYRLALRHIAPALLVLASLARPETQLSKRVSHLFFGHVGAPCTCGDGGSAFKYPHECPAMQDEMLKNAEKRGAKDGGEKANNKEGESRLRCLICLNAMIYKTIF